MTKTIVVDFNNIDAIFGKGPIGSIRSFQYKDKKYENVSILGMRGRSKRGESTVSVTFKYCSETTVPHD